MSNNLSEYRDLIRRLEAAPQVSPPRDFTQLVMGRLPGHKKWFLRMTGWRLVVPFKKIFSTAPTKEECAISFISMSFFYLVLGVLLLFWMRNMPGSELNGWLKFQSPVFILVALLLGLVGGSVWLMGKRALTFARWGLLTYIVIFIVSGLMISSKGEIQLILGTILLIGAILTGLSLNAFVGKYAYETSMSKR